ncbi:MAG: Blue-light-activated protein [Acidobacteria bacterium]|nr:Blue-light-activated protein [Acidobacteriota bacterium]
MSAPPDLPNGTARVLIVDDELQNRKLLEVMLGPEGLAVESAVNGEDALRKVARQPPDLILLDVMMPGMDGYEVAAAIKGNPATRNIPVIMITAMDDREARLRGLSVGAEDFLTKPVDRAELCVRVKNLLRLKAYGDYYDQYSQRLAGEVSARTADLREERDRAQRYLDTAGVILLALDPDGRITLVNRYACTMLGWTADELLGRDWVETCVPARIGDAVRATLADTLRAAIGEGDRLHLSENPIVTRAGIERLIEWRSTVVRDGRGAIAGSFRSGTDVTERTQAVRALSATEGRTRFVLQSADVGTWDLDYATGVLHWSDVLEAQHGIRPGTFGGTLAAFVERVHPEDRTSVVEAIEQAQRSGADFALLHRSLWPDGTVRWLRGAGRVVLGQDGQPLRGTGISQDVTERRILERQYEQAGKMEAVGQLASGVAHDFNNLLTVILGFTELMTADEGLATHHANDLAEIVKAARQAATLTKQLLAFGRQQVLNPRPIDVNGVIADMTGMLGRLIGENVQIKLGLAPVLPAALADRSQLEQVMMNLVVNARDAMPDGGTVTIETGAADLENSAFHEETVMQGRYVVIGVTDTGVGMAAETRQRLFEPFFTTKEAGKGTGLGLSTTYGIIKQSKGYIWVYSEPGRGTTFRIYLPQSADAAAAPIDAAATPGAIARATETVLLVEDEAGVRQLSRRILDSSGYHVLEAANGEEAERIFAAHAQSIDLVVTDVVMPGCGGPELVARLKAQSPALRVLFMSGYSEQSVWQRMDIEAGGAFIQKPFTAKEFRRQVRHALEM